MEQNKRDRKVYILLGISCLATVWFAWRYTGQIKQTKQETEGEGTGDGVGTSMEEAYRKIVRELEDAEEKEMSREQAGGIVSEFIHAAFVDPDSREAMLAGCRHYVTDRVYKDLEVLSEYRDFAQDTEERTRELSFCEIYSDVDPEEGTGTAMALFTVRTVTDDEVAADETYLLRVGVEEAEDGGGYRIGTVYTMQEFEFGAD